MAIAVADVVRQTVPASEGRILPLLEVCQTGEIPATHERKIRAFVAGGHVLRSGGAA